MHLSWVTTLLFAGATSATKPPNKGCRPSSLTTITTTASPTVTKLPDSCTYRPTQTFYSSSGCAHTCATGFCIIDAPVTISCGCPRVAIETQTVTVCPTATPCQQCTTGWGTFLYTEPCSTSSTEAAARATAD